jgi:hypothetical protein
VKRVVTQPFIYSTSYVHTFQVSPPAHTDHLPEDSSHGNIGIVSVGVVKSIVVVLQPRHTNLRPHTTSSMAGLSARHLATISPYIPATRTRWSTTSLPRLCAASAGRAERVHVGLWREPPRARVLRVEVPDPSCPTGVEQDVGRLHVAVDHGFG